MSALELARWRSAARVWAVYMAVWFVAFVILDALGHAPALMCAAYVMAGALAGAGAYVYARRKRTAGVRAELRQVSKTKWTREG